MAALVHFISTVPFGFVGGWRYQYYRSVGRFFILSCDISGHLPVHLELTKGEFQPFARKVNKHCNYSALRKHIDQIMQLTGLVDLDFGHDLAAHPAPSNNRCQ